MSFNQPSIQQMIANAKNNSQDSSNFIKLPDVAQSQEFEIRQIEGKLKVLEPNKTQLPGIKAVRNLNIQGLKKDQE